VLPTQARFCLECGTAVGAEPPPPAPTLPEEPLTAAVRCLIPAGFAERLVASRGQMQNERRKITML
jgi:hypothetical protein